MKISKKSTFNMDSGENFPRNNQKGENIKDLNLKVSNSKDFFSRKFFKDLGIVESVGDGIIIF